MTAASTVPSNIRRELGATIAITGTFIEELGNLLDDKTMTAQQLQLLVQLWIHGELAQNDLSKFTHVERSANSRNIAKLGDGERPAVQRGPGWVEAFEDPNNRRYKLVRLTPVGRANLEKAAAAAARFLPR